jgi:hypothetical protein
MPDPFWKDNYSIVYDRRRLIEFVPTSTMTINEKLNSLTRLAIYSGILLSLLYKEIVYLYIPVVVMVMTFLLWRNHPQRGGQPEPLCPLEEPTKNNPFMNVLMTEYTDNPQRSPAADVEDPAIKAKMETYFLDGLYRDSNDIWDKNNSQRQFYTNPSTTIPNDVDSFMKWCFNTPYTCKDNNLQECGRRYKPTNLSQ